MVKELKQLPEQTPRYLPPHWEISKEFCEVIDRMPSFMGIIAKDGKSVEVGFLQSEGYKLSVPLGAYIKGKIYATLKGKTGTTYVPKDLEKKVLDQIKDIKKEINYSLSNITTTKEPAKEIWARLVKDDNTK